MYFPQEADDTVFGASHGESLTNFFVCSPFSTPLKLLLCQTVYAGACYFELEPNCNCYLQEMPKEKKEIKLFGTPGGGGSHILIRA